MKQWLSGCFVTLFIVLPILTVFLPAAPVRARQPGEQPAATATKVATYKCPCCLGNGSFYVIQFSGWGHDGCNNCGKTGELKYEILPVLPCEELYVRK
jgi:hypothetical protein